MQAQLNKKYLFGEIRLYYEELKKQLLSNVDEIIKAIESDKTIEIKKERDTLQIFEVKKKKYLKTKIK